MELYGDMEDVLESYHEHFDMMRYEIILHVEAGAAMYYAIKNVLGLPGVDVLIGLESVAKLESSLKAWEGIEEALKKEYGGE